MTELYDVALAIIVTLTTLGGSMGGIKMYRNYKGNGIPKDPDEYRNQMYTMMTNLTAEHNITKTSIVNMKNSITNLEKSTDNLFKKMKERDDKLNRACNDVCAIIKYLQINADNGETRELNILLGNRGRR